MSEPVQIESMVTSPSATSIEGRKITSTLAELISGTRSYRKSCDVGYLSDASIAMLRESSISWPLNLPARGRIRTLKAKLQGGYDISISPRNCSAKRRFSEDC